MKLGVITIKTTYSDNDFEIDWDAIQEIYSKRNYIITLSNGEGIIGKFSSSPNNLSAIRILSTDSIEINSKLADVIYIKPLDTNFWDKLYVKIVAQN